MVRSRLALQDMDVARSGLSIGLQLSGRPFDQATLLGTGAARESADDGQSRRPPIARNGKSPCGLLRRSQRLASRFDRVVGTMDVI
jgi:hypothetical protein